MEKFTVVENAGYEGERDIRSFEFHDDAEAFIERFYSVDEEREMHVVVRLDRADGSSTYECS